MGLPPSRWSVVLIGLFVAAMGLTPMLAALDVIPSPDSSFHAPRWVVFLAGGLFFTVGMWILMQAAVGENRAKVFGSAVGFSLVVGLAFLSNWIAFGSGTREGCSGTASFLGFSSSRTAADFECRAAFGYGALFMNVIIVRGIAWWLGNKAFPGNRAARALEKLSEWTMGLLLLPLIFLALLLQGVKTGSERFVNRLRSKEPDKTKTLKNP
jgi:hypothetical protein